MAKIKKLGIYDKKINKANSVASTSSQQSLDNHITLRDLNRQKVELLYEKYKPIISHNDQ